MLNSIQWTLQWRTLPVEWTLWGEKGEAKELKIPHTSAIQIRIKMKSSCWLITNTNNTMPWNLYSIQEKIWFLSHKNGPIFLKNYKRLQVQRLHAMARCVKTNGISSMTITRRSYIIMKVQVTTLPIGKWIFKKKKKKNSTYLDNSVRNATMLSKCSKGKEMSIYQCMCGIYKD